MALAKDGSGTAFLKRTAFVVLALTLVLTVTALQGVQAKTIRLGYVTWESEIASHAVLGAVLEDYLGYRVEHITLDAGPMWTGIAQGEFDVTIAAWLPTTHAPYYEQLWTQIENLGPAMHGAKIGLVVPTYVTINSIEELNAERSRFGGRIVGIDPGAGIMQRTEEAIEAYGLDFMLVDGSDAAMTAALRSAIRRNQWIVVTGWTPHWKFAEYDLKYLEDPKGVYGGSEEITKIVRKGLHEDAPDAYKLLQRFYWTPEQMAEVLVAILEGADPADAARQWIAANEDVVRSWLP